MKKYLKYSQYCPYCYSKIENPTEFYCLKCEKTVSKKIDNSLEVDYRGLPICTCGNGPMVIKCSNQRCANFKNIIPPEETPIVLIAGMADSGKSNFLRDIVSSQSESTNILVSPKSHAVIRWREEHRNDILDGNDPENDNFSSVIGMQVVGGKKELCLSLTDRPGEETQDLEKLLGLNYVFCADYIILIIDPQNIPGIAESLKDKGLSITGAHKNENKRIRNIVAIDNIITAVVQKRGKLGKNIPFMVGISKFDFIEKAGLCPTGFSIGCCDNRDTASVLGRNKKFDTNKWENNSKVIRKFLKAHNENQVVEKLEGYFKTVSYFAFSSYGYIPKENGDPPGNRNPRHIMDPFYWILNNKRII